MTESYDPSTGPLIEISGKPDRLWLTGRGGARPSTGPLIEISGKLVEPDGMPIPGGPPSTGPLIEISGKCATTAVTTAVPYFRLQRGR